MLMIVLWGGDCAWIVVGLKSWIDCVWEIMAGSLLAVLLLLLLED